MVMSFTKFQLLILLEALTFYLLNKDKIKKQFSLKQLTANNKSLSKKLKDTLNKIDFSIAIKVD